MSDNNLNNAAPSPVPIPNPMSYINQGGALIQRNIWMAIIFVIIPGTASSIIGMTWISLVKLSNAEITHPEELLRLLSGGGIDLIITIAATILWIFIVPALFVGVIACFWEGVQTGELTTRALTSRKHMHWQIIVAFILLVLIYLCFSFVTHFIPGVGSTILVNILTIPFFSLSLLVMYDLAVDNAGAIPALVKGFKMLKADILNLSIIGLLAMILHFIGMILCGVGVLITTPIILAAYGYLYRDKTL